jgi:hypothetical protein
MSRDIEVSLGATSPDSIPVDRVVRALATAWENTVVRDYARTVRLDVIRHLADALGVGVLFDAAIHAEEKSA